MSEGIEQLKGKMLSAIKGAEVGSDHVIFETADGEKFFMRHHQDCCEGVALNEIIGDVADLLGSPILEAEEATNSDNKPSDYAESWTWTFYKLGTAKGFVTLRWLGESNGYYGEEVSFERAR